MLVKRRLSLPPQVLLEPLLRRELFDDVLRAEQLLERAAQQADAMLQDAEYQCQQQLQSAQALFWEETNLQLQAFADENLAFQRELLASVDRLLLLAMTRLLDETDLSGRIRALLRNLSDSQAGRAAATLSCHPQQAQAVQAWLEDSGLVALWAVQQDTQVPLQALRLSHAQGAFEIDWEQLRAGLLGHSERQAVADTPLQDGALADNQDSRMHSHQQGD